MLAQIEEIKVELAKATNPEAVKACNEVLKELEALQSKADDIMSYYKNVMLPILERGEKLD